MSQETNRLTSMVKEAPDQVEGLGKSIDAIQNEMDAIQPEIDAVTDGVCGNAETLAVAYITGIILPLWQLVQPTAYVVYGPGFGSIAWSDPGPVGNIAAWGIWFIPIPALPVPVLLYPYTPGVDPILDVLVVDYSFGNDYITRPIAIGSTYGLQGNFDLASAGKSTLQANQTKIDDSIAVLSRYAT